MFCMLLFYTVKHNLTAFWLKQTYFFFGHLLLNHFLMSTEGEEFVSSMSEQMSNFKLCHYKKNSLQKQCFCNMSLSLSLSLYLSLSLCVCVCVCVSNCFYHSEYIW